MTCMYRCVIVILIFFGPLSIVSGQSADSIYRKKNEQMHAIVQWFHNRNSTHPLLDTATMESLRDSGRYENGFKTGVWKEYTIDSSLMGLQTDVNFGNRSTQLTFSATLIRSVGAYSNGKRNGIWTEYTTDNTQFPFSWRRTAEVNYTDGFKDGKEIQYQGYLQQTPFIIRNWTNGVESGVGEKYDLNYPYALRQRTKIVDGVTWITETYYRNGKLESAFTDTTINGQPLKYLHQYHISGYLIRTGFYDGKMKTGVWTDYYANGVVQSISNYKDDKLNGKYEYFYDNGQLWTERIFEEGKLISVNSNFSRDGYPQAIGTIKNGNGTVLLYDEAGNLVKTIWYENGEEKYSSH